MSWRDTFSRYDDTPYLDATAPLTPLEIACGMALGPMNPPKPPPLKKHGPTAREVLEAEILQHLLTGPVAVSFSGGRDSSLILAIACHVARREGLPLPRAITMRHPSPESDESDWQELVIGHLRVDDWVSVDVSRGLDLLGSASMDLLHLHGVQAPPNAYLHASVAAAAEGRTVITGAGGDEFLGSWGPRLAQVRARTVAPRPRDAATWVLAHTPAPWQRRWRARRVDPLAPWLAGPALSEVRMRLAAESHAQSWVVEALRFVRSRRVALLTHALTTVGRRHGVDIVSPMMTPGFAAALGREYGAAGPVGRTPAMQGLGSDLLPQTLLGRRSKATFGGLVFGPEFRAFVRSWTTAAIDPALRPLVDAGRLQSAWLQQEPLYGSALAAQHEWLRSRSSV